MALKHGWWNRTSPSPPVCCLKFAARASMIIQRTIEAHENLVWFQGVAPKLKTNAWVLYGVCSAKKYWASRIVAIPDDCKSSSLRRFESSSLSLPTKFFAVLQQVLRWVALTGDSYAYQPRPKIENWVSITQMLQQKGQADSRYLFKLEAWYLRYMLLHFDW